MFRRSDFILTHNAQCAPTHTTIDDTTTNIKHGHTFNAVSPRAIMFLKDDDDSKTNINSHTFFKILPLRDIPIFPQPQ